MEYGFDRLVISTFADGTQKYLTSGGTTLVSYAYDDLGRRASLHYNGTSGASMAYTWSAENDLTALSNDLAGTANDVSFANTFTPAHQWASSTQSNAAYVYVTPSASSLAFTANALNEYDTQGGRTQYNDTRGNFLGAVAAAPFAYDAENHFVAQPGVSLANAYDPLGRRTSKTVSGTVTTNFVQDGDTQIADYDGSGALTRRFVPGPAIDDYVAMVTAAGTKTFFHTDKMGSVIAMSDMSGNLVEGPYVYEDFGACFSGGASCTAQSAATVPFRFTGQRLDFENGFYDYRARFYAPTRGRFIQTDPVGTKDDLNLYTYVGNDPTDRTDPTGLASCDNVKNCPDIPRASGEVEAAALRAASPMSLAPGQPESGAVVIVSTANGSVTNTLTGTDAGRPDSNKPSAKFNFRYKRDQTSEQTGATVHSHPKAGTGGILALGAPRIDKSNQYPSSTDLQKTMNTPPAPLIIKDPRGAVIEVFRTNGVDHMVTLSGPQPTTSIPSDINHNFVVDPP